MAWTGPSVVFSAKERKRSKPIKFAQTAAADPLNAQLRQNAEVAQ
jgi:hypothetical protein